MSSQNTIITNVMDKLDQLPLQFNISDSDIVPCLNDALREMGIMSALDGVVSGSTTELYIEIRTQWYMLSRLRNSASVNFKYSTGIDGKSVDKSMIPEMISKIMAELDQQFSRWFSTGYRRTSGSVWNKSQRQNTRLAGDD